MLPWDNLQKSPTIAYSTPSCLLRIDQTLNRAQICCTFSKKINFNFWGLLYRVSDCCLTPCNQFFTYFMARKSYILMKQWWRCSLCTRPKPLVGVLAHWLSREAANINLIVFGLTLPSTALKVNKLIITSMMHFFHLEHWSYNTWLHKS